MNFDPLSVDAELVNRLRRALTVQRTGTEVSVLADLLEAVENRIADLVTVSLGAGESLTGERLARMTIKSDLVAETIDDDAEINAVNKLRFTARIFGSRESTTCPSRRNHPGTRFPLKSARASRINSPKQWHR